MEKSRKDTYFLRIMQDFYEFSKKNLPERQGGEPGDAQKTSLTYFAILTDRFSFAALKTLKITNKTISRKQQEKRDQSQSE